MESVRERFIKELELETVAVNPSIEPKLGIPFKPTREAILIAKLIKEFFPERRMSTPDIHYLMWSAVLYTNKDVTIEVFRGGAKTTAITVSMSLVAAILGGLPNLGKVVNIAIFSATTKQAKDIIASIKGEWEQSPKMQRVLKIARDSLGQVIAYTKHEICFENAMGEHIYIQGMSTGQELRGITRGTRRLQLVFLDDSQKSSILTSKVEMQKLITWWASSLKKAGDSEALKIINVGTGMVMGDLLAVTAEINELALKIPICQGLHLGKGQMQLAWEENMNEDDILEELREAVVSGTQTSFSRERMLERVSYDDMAFDLSAISSFKEGEHPPLEELNIYMTADVSTGDNEDVDLTAIITVGVDADWGLWVLRIDTGILDPQQQNDLVEEHVREFKPRGFKGEKAAISKMFSFWLKKHLREQGLYLRIEELKSDKVSKMARIMTLEPYINSGRLHLPVGKNAQGTPELLLEISKTTRDGVLSRYDDALDALANFMDDGFINSFNGNGGVQAITSKEYIGNGVTIEYKD